MMCFFVYVLFVKFENHQKVGELEDTMQEDFTQEDVITQKKKTGILKLIIQVFLTTSFIQVIQEIVTNF